MSRAMLIAAILIAAALVMFGGIAEKLVGVIIGGYSLFVLAKTSN